MLLTIAWNILPGDLSFLQYLWDEDDLIDKPDRNFSWNVQKTIWFYFTRAEQVKKVDKYNVKKGNPKKHPL